LKGVENVFTQHRPVLFETLDLLIKGKLKPASFPYVDTPSSSKDAWRHDDIFVFMLGGTTYEEAASIVAISEQNPGVKIILGGSCIHNSHTFLDDVLGYGGDKDVVINMKSARKGDM